MMSNKILPLLLICFSFSIAQAADRTFEIIDSDENNGLGLTTNGLQVFTYDPLDLIENGSTTPTVGFSVESSDTRFAQTSFDLTGIVYQQNTIRFEFLNEAQEFLFVNIPSNDEVTFGAGVDIPHVDVPPLTSLPAFRARGSNNFGSVSLGDEVRIGFVPEPSASLLALLGCGCLLRLRR